MGQSLRTLLGWAAFVFFLFFMWSAFGEIRTRNDRVLFSQVMAALEEGRIKQMDVTGQTLTGEFTSGVKFQSTGVLTDSVLESLHRANRHFGTQYAVRKERSGMFWLFLLQWMPMLLILGLFLFFMRQLQAGSGKIMSFGKSRARRMTEKQSSITFADVAGAGESKRELQEVVAFLQNSKQYTRLGGRIPKGVLLIGAPGTGKTLLAKAVAGEAKVPFFSIAGSEFMEVFVGIGPSRVRDLFEQGKRSAPCLIFIDEIDAVGRNRSMGLGSGHQEQEQTLNQLLVEMDGFEANTGVVVVAATNRPEMLDPAILRPGRFDRHVIVGKPDLSGREAILQVHTRRIKLADDVDLGVVGRATPGMTGADLENLVNEAALLAAHRGKEAVGMKEFESAGDKILMGAERASVVMSRKELEATAYHEAGHALVSCLLKGKQGEPDPVHKVTIIPRGAALGLTMQLPLEDRHSINEAFAYNQIAVLMGGRIGEEIALGQSSSGAANDFEKATELAGKMVREWGMSKEVGLAFHKTEQSNNLLGFASRSPSQCSETMANKIDMEISRILSQQYQRAKALLQKNVEVLRKTAQALLEYETISGEELHTLIAGGHIAREKPVSRFKTPKQWMKEQGQDRKNQEEQDQAAQQQVVASQAPSPQKSSEPENPSAPQKEQHASTVDKATGRESS
ncbi:MAG: ATP-dependent zinc metalloprotease FtsH [Myxococcota bacterium]